MTSGIPQGEYILLGPEADPGFLEGGSNSEMLKPRPFRSFTGMKQQKYLIKRVKAWKAKEIS